MASSLVVALSGINASDNPGPGVPIARSLKESDPDCSLIGLSYDVHDSGNYMSSLFKTTSRLPFPSKGWNSLFPRVLEIHAKEKFDILIPSLDAELPLYIRHQEELAQEGIKTLLPTEHQFQIRSKDRLAEICEQFHLRYPKTVAVSSVDELNRVLTEKIEPPCMVKGCFYKAYLVHSSQQATLKFHEIAEEWGLPVLVQEVISGKEINLIGLGDGQGGSCGLVAIKKLSTTQIGKILTGVTISHPKLMEYG
jgi:carbamoyl-phosphate synthase large subunit